MTRSRPTDTKARIQAVARELFARQGVQQTSLRDIAARLGITKPALYYHFDSREALVRSILQPLLDDLEAFVAAREGVERHDARALLSDYFDMLHAHRDVIVMLVRDLATLGDLGLTEKVIAWRHRVIALLLGPAPTLAARVGAVVAIGGLSDCTLEFAEHPTEAIKALVVEAALAALDPSA